MSSRQQQHGYLSLALALALAALAACGGAPASTTDAAQPTPTVFIAAPTGTPIPPTVPPPEATPTPLPESTATPEATPTGPAPVYGYRVVNTYPHDRQAFTQGLVFEDGFMYEGTGLRGRSTLRKVDLETGNILQMRQLEDRYFGEGVAVYGDRIIQLTWQSNIGFVYDKGTFELLQDFSYPTEGWGLTHDGARLIMSDGTPNLYFLDPETFQETGRVQVYDDDGLVRRLNELEYIRGEVYANVWQTDRIARIDPETGRVVAWIDLTGLLGPEDRHEPVDVLNGIAYDAENDRLFVTGKLWPKIFEIELVSPTHID